MSHATGRPQVLESDHRLRSQGLLTPGLDNTRLYMSLTAGAGTRCMSLLSSSPSLWDLVDEEEKRSCNRVTAAAWNFPYQSTVDDS